MRQDSEHQIRNRRLAVWTVVVLLAGLWLVWSQWDRLVDLVGGGPATEVAQQPLTGTAGPHRAPAEESAGDDEHTSLERSWVEMTGTAPAWPDDFASPIQCESVEQNLRALCQRLDSRDYVRERLIGGGICSLLEQVGEELADNPPAPASELRSYAVILSNVFHLFRVAGRKRLELPREILRREPDLIEPVAMALYRWLIVRERCASGRATAMRLERLYDYAGFLIHTLGGQAYLRRRSPRVEALASFYSLLILDRAAERGQNPHGFDPRPEIRRCRQLLATQPLVFRERYLALLEEMAHRWDSRGRL